MLRQIKGRDKPRVAPPVPARSRASELVDTATGIGIDLYPWQRTTGRYLYAVDKDERWLFPEVAVIVSRQQGKTEILVPHIIKRLRMGRRIMHSAQNRELPREVFGRVADILSQDMTLFPERGGRTVRPRFANGQEEIRLANGGLYRIVAPTRGGARGPSNDDVIIDELREMDSLDFIAAAEPTLLASDNPQILYLSNAGEDDSIVLNAIRERAGKDPSLAYLEWSAAPDRAAGDRAGWIEANPSIGHRRGVMEYLERKYESYRLSGSLAIFETEHLCRWVNSTREPLVEPAAWALCEVESLPATKRPYMGISMDPSGTRASAVLAWQDADGVAMRSLLEARGEPIDIPTLAADLRAKAQRYRVGKVAFDPMTDAELAKYFTKPEGVTGSKYANATAQFVNLVESRNLRWTNADAVTDDLTWTARKAQEETGSFQAVRANDDRPVTAVLAAIRAVWMASGPRPPIARIF